MNNITQSISKVFHKTVNVVKDHSPEILMVTGVVGTVTSGVLACKATLKAVDIVNEAKENIDIIHEALEREDISEEQYSEEDSKKDLAIVYTQTAVKMLKTYAPALILGGLSIGCMVSSNSIMKKRNIALAAAYATVDKSFKEYRNRVIDRFGEEVDKQIKYNLDTVKVTEVVEDEDGNQKKVKKTIEVANSPTMYSPYAMIFDETNPYWEKDAELNRFFLESRQWQANDKLKANGRLFLNEVYEMLGREPTKAGQIVGWVYDLDNPVGDNYVDFGMYDIYTKRKCDAEAKAAFINGYERSIILDFNVDGNIQKLLNDNEGLDELNYGYRG